MTASYSETRRSLSEFFSIVAAGIAVALAAGSTWFALVIFFACAVGAFLVPTAIIYAWKAAVALEAASAYKRGAPIYVSALAFIPWFSMMAYLALAATANWVDKRPLIGLLGAIAGILVFSLCMSRAGLRRFIFPPVQLTNLNG